MDSPSSLLLTIGRRMHSTGFCVPCTVSGVFRLVASRRDRPQRRSDHAHLANARCLPLRDRVQTRLMLPMVIAAPEHEAGLRPDDLRADVEVRRFEALDHRARMHAACQT